MSVLGINQGPVYLLRFDDICPTMNWGVWGGIEEVLIDNEIRPILAVVPDNKDPVLHQGPENDRFWDRVRAWQARGWAIGLHGYQHLYVTSSAGMVGLNRYSEFAGLAYEEQLRKIQAGLAIFERERVTADVWVAPAHTFDENTVKALVRSGLTRISDGFDLQPYTDAEGIFWIPQQLGAFRSMPTGFWTICIHLDDPICRDTNAFRQKVEHFRERMVSLPDVLSMYSGTTPGVGSKTFAQCFRWAKLLKLRMMRLA